MVINFSDVTISVYYDMRLGEKKILELINACVSHEMRNPINAIMAMNLKLRDLFDSLFSPDYIENPIHVQAEIQKTLEV